MLAVTLKEDTQLLGEVVAVSYTHLDVYKRQLQYGGGSEFLVVVYKYVGAGNPLSVELAPHGFSPTGVGNGEVSVSYTHLDVYKRQE